MYNIYFKFVYADLFKVYYVQTDAKVERKFYGIVKSLDNNQFLFIDYTGNIIMQLANLNTLEKFLIASVSKDIIIPEVKVDLIGLPKPTTFSNCTVFNTATHGYKI